MAEEGECLDNNLYQAARNPSTNIPIDIKDPRFRYRTSGDCNNVLHVAAKCGNQQFIIESLAGLGDHRYHLLCQQNSKDETPLHLASQFGHMAIVEALLLAHDDVQAGVGPFVNGRKPCWRERDKKGDTALHMALRNGHEDIAILLLDRDIDQLVSIDNELNQSLAYLAVESSCNRFLQTIIDADRGGQCSISFSGPVGRTVFHSASFRSSVAVLNSLIEIRRGPLLKVQDHKGWSAVHYAVSKRKRPSVEALLTADRSLAYLQDKKGRTPLHIASMMGMFSIVSAILELSPQSIEFRDNHGKTALHVAKMNSGFVKKCLNNTTMKELINEVDNDGNTPLHVALIKTKPDVAFQLFSVDGCNWRLKNNKRESPVGLCQSNDKIGYLDKIHFALLDVQREREDMRSKTKRYLAYAGWYISKTAIPILRHNLVWMEDEELERAVNKIAIAAFILLPLSFTTSFDVPGGYDASGNRGFTSSNELAMMVGVFVLIGCTFGFTKNVRKKRLIAGSCIRGLQLSLCLTALSYMFGMFSIFEKKYTHKSSIYLGILTTLLFVAEMWFVSHWAARQD